MRAASTRIFSTNRAGVVFFSAANTRANWRGLITQRAANAATLNLSSLPTKLSGVEVKVNGAFAAVYYISPTQVTFQVPSGILNGPSGTVLVSNPVIVQLFQDGVGSNTLTTTGTSSSPGIFPIIVNGKNYPAGVFPDGTLTGDPANGSIFRKAKPGDVIQLFATGLFRTQAGVVLPPQTFTDVTVTIGNPRLPRMRRS